MTYTFTDACGNDCNTHFPHADLTGNGMVEINEFSIISNNFLKTGDATCWSSPGMAPPGGFGRPALRAQAQPRGLRSFTIEELRRRGLGHLAIADLNGDGVIDEVDIALFFAGVRP